jgi:hypothetical protein
MLKFKITSERFADACTIAQNISIINGKSQQMAIHVLPYFLLNNEGEYVIVMTPDADGDPVHDAEQYTVAFSKIFTTLKPKRLETLAKELLEAAENIVNPPKEGG